MGQHDESYSVETKTRRSRLHHEVYHLQSNGGYDQD